MCSFIKYRSYHDWIGLSGSCVECYWVLEANHIKPRFIALSASIYDKAQHTFVVENILMVTFLALYRKLEKSYMEIIFNPKKSFLISVLCALPTAIIFSSMISIIISITIHSCIKFCLSGWWIWTGRLQNRRDSHSDDCHANMAVFLRPLLSKVKKHF